MLMITTVIFAHPIKMNTGKLIVNTTTKECQVTLNFFKDDFETALKQTYPQDKININNISKSMQTIIMNYIEKYFEIKVEETPIKWKLKNIENIEKKNVCQVTFTGKLPDYKTSSKLAIRNAVLFSTYKQQSNILHIYIDEHPLITEEFYSVITLRLVPLFFS